MKTSILVTKTGTTNTHVPGRVAGVGEREVAHAQLVHHPQRAEAVADAVPALDSNEAGDLALLEHPPDVCSKSEGEKAILLLHLKLYP